MFTAYTFALFGTTLLFLQKAMQVAWDAHILNRPLRSVPLFWLSLTTFLYSAMIFASLYLHGPQISYAIFCAFPVIGSLKQSFYVSTLVQHLGLNRKSFRLPKRVFGVLAIAYALGWVIWVVSGVEVVLNHQPNPHISPMLIKMGLDGFTPTAFTMATSGIFLGFMVYAQLRVLRQLRRKGGELYLVMGIAVTFLALINETLGGMGILTHTYSLMFLAEGIEIFRLSAILRFGAQTRAESLERDIQAMTPMVHLGLFVGAIAHDIRNPLSVISSVNGLLEERLAERPGVDGDQTLSTLIQRSVNRIEGIIRQYLALARSESLSDNHPVKIDRVLNEAIGLSYRKICAAGNPRLEVDAPEELMVSGNTLLLEMLFANLISNAATAVSARPEGVIRIKAREENGSCVIEVHDNGDGIAPEHRAKLFKQVWSSQSHSGDGTGLGLRIVGQIVQRHGGSIRLVESAPTTCFEIKLPCSQFEHATAPIGV